MHSQCSETLALGDDNISNDVRSLLKDAEYCYFQRHNFSLSLEKEMPFPSFPWSLWRLKSPPGYLLLPGKQILSLGFPWKHTPLWAPSCDTASSWATWRIPLMKQKKTVTFPGSCSFNLQNMNLFRTVYARRPKFMRFSAAVRQRCFKFPQTVKSTFCFYLLSPGVHSCCPPSLFSSPSLPPSQLCKC